MIRGDKAEGFKSYKIHDGGKGGKKEMILGINGMMEKLSNASVHISNTFLLWGMRPICSWLLFLRKIGGEEDWQDGEKEGGRRRKCINFIRTQISARFKHAFYLQWADLFNGSLLVRRKLKCVIVEIGPISCATILRYPLKLLPARNNKSGWNFVCSSQSI